MQVDDPLLGEVLHWSFSAMNIRLLEVPASNSWWTLCWLGNFIPELLLKELHFPKMSPHPALLAAGASSDPWSQMPWRLSHLCWKSWFTLLSIGNGREGGVWALVLNKEFQSALSWQWPSDCNQDALPLQCTTPVIQPLTVWGPWWCWSMWNLSCVVDSVYF